MIAPREELAERLRAARTLPEIMAENARLTDEVERLRKAFGHIHVAQPDPVADTSCAKCGLDLRDPIHQCALNDRLIALENPHV